MKKPYNTFVLLLLCLLPWLAQSQRALPFILKLDAAAPAHRAVGGGLEWRFNSRTGVEIKAQSEWHAHNPEEVFPGNWVRHFTERQVDSFNVLYKETLNAPEIFFVGEGRPLPVSPGLQVPLSTTNITLGYRFLYGKKWQWFLQPGMTIARHRYMQIKDALTIESDDMRRWDVPSQHLLVSQRTLSARQERIMREKAKWFGGVRYDMGVSRSLGARFLVELRAAGSVQFFMPYRVRAPRAVREVSWQYHLMVGYRLGYPYR